jgi:hypothetical protein
MKTTRCVMAVLLLGLTGLTPSAQAANNKFLEHLDGLMNKYRDNQTATGDHALAFITGKKYSGADIKAALEAYEKDLQKTGEDGQADLKLLLDDLKDPTNFLPGPLKKLWENIVQELAVLRARFLRRCQNPWADDPPDGGGNPPPSVAPPEGPPAGGHEEHGGGHEEPPKPEEHKPDATKPEEHKPEEHKPEEHPAGEHPAAEHPAGEHPAAEHPAGEHPAAEHPAGEHPAAEHPAAEHPPKHEEGGHHAAGEAGDGALPGEDTPPAHHSGILPGAPVSLRSNLLASSTRMHLPRKGSVMSAEEMDAAFADYAGARLDAIKAIDFAANKQLSKDAKSAIVPKAVKMSDVYGQELENKLFDRVKNNKTAIKRLTAFVAKYAKENLAACRAVFGALMKKLAQYIKNAVMGGRSDLKELAAPPSGSNPAKEDR